MCWFRARERLGHGGQPAGADRQLVAGHERLQRARPAVAGHHVGARRHVVSNYSWSRVLQSLMGRYQSALARIPDGVRGLAGAETSTQ